MSSPEPIPSTHAWCFNCRAIKPTREPQPIAPAAPGFYGEMLVCQGCGMTIARVYVVETKEDRDAA